jgi:hypothetical protein
LSRRRGGRRPVKTYVGEYDEELVKQATMCEQRGGQVFFVHNRMSRSTIRPSGSEGVHLVRHRGLKSCFSPRARRPNATRLAP